MKPTRSQKYYIYLRDRKRCHFCLKELKFRQISIDHYLPKSCGGTDDIFNLVLSCKKCNKLKQNEIPPDYREVMIELFKRGVNDRMIMAPGNISFKKLQANVERVNRLEAINKYVIFQSDTLRFYVKSNRIIKVVKIGHRFLK